MNTNTSNIYLAVLLAITLFSCGTGEDQATVQNTVARQANQVVVPKSQFESSGMKLGELSEQSIPTVISTRGYVDVPPGSKASISPYYGGYVKEINILPGQQVRKGELLFTLQNPEFIDMQQQFLEAKEQLEYLKIDFERQQTLANENIASQKSMKKAESDYKVMLARFAGLSEQLKLINISIKNLENGNIRSTIPIYATLSGSITAVNTTKGAFLNAADIAVEITNVDHLHLELQVFEKDALMIEEEQVINFKVPESGEEIFYGSVHLVGKSVDGNDRTINVHGHVGEEDEKRFIPGMFVEAEIETDKDTGLCLPEGAVVEMDGEMYVLTRTGEKEDAIYFEQELVQVGKSANGWIEILNPNVLQGKQVLTNGTFSLISG
ncbi:MAG: efflux RND transporter periplasmic adaptor subunit [Cyclobacteriaceae bacterium]